MATPTQPRTSNGLSYLHPGSAAVRLSVMLGPGAGQLPPALRRLNPVVAHDLSAVRATSQVAVLYGCGMADRCRELAAPPGGPRPRIMMLAPTADAVDIVAAFRNGATSYMLDNADPGSGAACLSCAVRGTADGKAHLHPAVAAVLISRLERRSAPQQTGGRRRPATEGLGSVLSQRERDVMEALVRGNSPGEIAVRLSLTEKTVRNYLSNIYKKLQVRSQAQAVLCWLDQAPHNQSAGERA